MTIETSGIANLTWEDMLARERPKADARIQYGEDGLQFAELWLPSTRGPHPVVLLIHGGCWLAEYPGLELLTFAAEALRGKGLAVWNVEYRRLGHAGGGYPGTFLDVARGADYLRHIAPIYDLDLAAVVAAGHSAGGHLALWLAGRHNLPRSGALYGEIPLALRGVVSLAGPGDLEQFATVKFACGDGTVERLVGFERRGGVCAYQDTSPANLLPLGVRQILIHGVYDAAVPPFVGLTYRDQAARNGDDIELQSIPDAGHFEVIAPWTPAWIDVQQAIMSLFGTIRVR